MKSEVFSTPLRKVYIKTFGCQMNEYDSEKMFALLREQYRSTTSCEDADLVIINTCSVRYKAEKKLYDILGALAKKKKDNPNPIIGVAGCVAQQEGEKILKRCKAVDFVVGTHNLSFLPSLVENASRGLPRSVVVDEKDDWDTLDRGVNEASLSGFIDYNNQSAFGAFYSPVRAYVAIQRGCNKHCSYCVVPTTRGREVSRARQEIIREVRAKVAAGAQEVLLLGQTVNSYGKDLVPRASFEDLVRDIANISGIKRIRFVSPHPQDVTDGFIALFGEIPQLCPQIHLPVQSGSDRILKLMSRNYRVGRYLDIINGLRSIKSEMAITSDFIVGFPTETEEDFESTLALMEQVRYSFSYSFIYSPRPNTVASSKFENDQLVAHDICSERLKKLQDFQTSLCQEYNDKWIGRNVLAMVEGFYRNKPDSARARTLEGVQVEVYAGGGLKVGEEVEVKIEQASPYDVKGSICQG